MFDDDRPETGTVTYRNHGTAPVTLSLSLDAPAAVFTLADDSVTVPAGGEPESYDLAIEPIDRDGSPADSTYAVFFDLATGIDHSVTGAATTLRLPKGEYGLFSFIGEEEGGTGRCSRPPSSPRSTRSTT